jgi:hypothetical protein
MDEGIAFSVEFAAARESESGPSRRFLQCKRMSAFGVRVQPVSATPLEVYRLAFRSPRSFAVAD